MSKVITRFPPSPTGNFHIGSARTALFNYLYAKNQGGEMILRFEDTDKARSKEEFEKDILESLEWLGIKYDDGPYKQSERGEVYKKHLQKLIDEGKAYISKEEVKEEGDRPEVIRFKNPNTTITFNDEVRGEITFDTTELKDFVIAKSLEEPLYHFAVVVDDAEMGITHIIRGEDHISNTPRQILILEALGFERPVYAHIPLILAPDKSKMSKRHGAVSITEYKEMGYLPEALINYLALLGWNPGDDREIFSIDDLIKEFSLEKVQKSGAVFNQEKLDWINKKYLEKIPEEGKKEIIRKVFGENLSDDVFEKIIPIVFERIHKISELEEAVENGEWDWLVGEPEYEKELLYWKDNKDDSVYIKRLQFVREKLNELNEDFSPEDVKNLIWDFASQEGRGDVLWPLRVAFSGKEKSPDPFELVYVLGRDESINRINNAISKLNE